MVLIADVVEHVDLLLGLGSQLICVQMSSIGPGWVAPQKGNECPHLSRKSFCSVGIEGEEIRYCLKNGCVWSKHGE